ncbi:MAG: hypothetical protein JW827_10085 [Spirochaetes bacterium]|nr:hypothetical protein [Spirochaetota bacterium]
MTIFNKEIYTLIVAVIVVGFLLFLYARFYFKARKIKRAVVLGDKVIKKAHYVLKHNGFKTLDVNRVYKYTIVTKGNKIIQKTTIDIIAWKKGKKYAIFYNITPEMQAQGSLSETLLFKLLLGGFKHGAVILPDMFSIREFKINY